MFVYTVKWNKKTALLIILIAALVICALILLIGALKGSGSGARVSNTQERVEYLESLGWEIQPESEIERSVVIPREFSEIYSAYNQLQLAQGYDLSKYCGLNVNVYTYSILNYKGYTGHVVAEVYVYNSEIVGGDVHSLELDGFMHGLKAK
ncbi:MAG: DUF4830 domain-containing protein [Oscillospiraceae bacterium]|jgi:hypothetical protein|nr:DUF4830 domain-containing protein [Oscillospiraceae bacterium]